MAHGRRLKEQQPMGNFQLHEAPAQLIGNSLKWSTSGNIYMNEVAAYCNVDQLIFLV